MNLSRLASDAIDNEFSYLWSHGPWFTITIFVSTRPLATRSQTICVESEALTYGQHDEEESGPDEGAGQSEDDLGISDEDETRSRCDDVLDGLAGADRQVAQHGEGDDAGDQARHRVDEARDHGVAEAVVLERVVRAERRQGARADRVGEEDLRRAVDPRTRLGQQRPIGRDVVEQAHVGALQRHGAHQQNEQDHVREQRREPHDLQRTTVIRTTSQ